MPSVSRNSTNLKLSMGVASWRPSMAGRSARMRVRCLLRHADRAIGLFERVASCFIDHRTPESVAPELPTPVGQRVCGIALGYEDLNDHDHLRHDPVLALLSDRLAAKLRPADIDGAAGAIEEVARTVAHIRARWPGVAILLRADSGFARDDMMAWCEANGVDYLFGPAGNARLRERVAREAARAEPERTGKPARRFADFTYSTRRSRSRARRAVGKAGHLAKGADPRFAVTSLLADALGARRLYERLYCARGERETRIKECQLDLFADRTSAAAMRANQPRLRFASLAYVPIDSLRRIALAGTALARATAGSIRVKLLKIGGRVTVPVRRLKIAMTSAQPWRRDFSIAHERLSIAAC